MVGGGRRCKRLETGEERSSSLWRKDLLFALVQAFAGMMKVGRERTVLGCRNPCKAHDAPDGA